MPIEIQVDRTIRIATISQIGDLDVPFLTEALRRLDQASVDPSFDLVYDFERVSNAPSMIAGLALGSFWADHRDRFRGRVAVVAPSRLQTRQGLAVMEASARLASVELHVFENRASASEWLSAATAYQATDAA